MIFDFLCIFYEFGIPLWTLQFQAMHVFRQWPGPLILQGKMELVILVSFVYFHPLLHVSRGCHFEYFRLLGGVHPWCRESGVFDLVYRRILHDSHG